MVSTPKRRFVGVKRGSLAMALMAMITMFGTISCNRALDVSKPSSSVRSAPLYAALKKGKENIFATPLERQKTLGIEIKSDLAETIQDATTYADSINNPCQVDNYLVYYTDSSERVQVAAAKLYYGTKGTTPTESGTLEGFYAFKNDYYAKLKSSGNLSDVVSSADPTIQNYQLTELELALSYLFIHHIDSIAPSQVREMQDLFISTIKASEEVSPEYKKLASSWMQDIGDTEIIVDQKPCGWWCWLRGLKGVCTYGRDRSSAAGEIIVYCQSGLNTPYNCRDTPHCLSKFGDPNSNGNGQ